MEDPLGVAHALGASLDIARVYADADLVCIASVARGVIRGDPPNRCEASVIKTLKGKAGPIISVAYPALPRQSEWLQPPNYLEGDRTYLFLLKQTSYGLIPFRGRGSIYVVRNGAYLDLGGAPAPWVMNFLAPR